MEVRPRDVLELELDGKGRVLIPAEKRREHGLGKGDTVEVVILGTQ